MIEWLFWPVLCWAMTITVMHARANMQWRAYHKALAAAKTTELRDAKQAAWNAGQDPERCTFVRDGKVVHVGKNVSERTKAEISRPAPVVVRNALPGRSA